jgi:menaquinone-specific isochorismate synthase
MTAVQAETPLVARTVRIADPGAPLLALLPREHPLAWVRRGEGLVGWGEAVRIRTGRGGDPGASGTDWLDRFNTAEDAWHQLLRHAVVRDEVGVSGTGPVAFGSFSFSPDSPAGGVLIVPEVVVGHRDGQWWLTTVNTGAVVPATPTLATDPAEQDPVIGPGRVTFTNGALSAQEWMDTVAEAIDRITDGHIDKVVLARDQMARAQAPLDPRWLLRQLAGRYPGTWTFCVDGLIGATPEMLVRRDKGMVTSRVLAGTIRRSGDDERDLALAASLARSSKDLEEHEYAVRSVAEALAPHCTSMNVPESPFVLHLANVMHLATDVTGVLRDGTTSLGLAAALHPSAAVCGTPTQDAATLITQIEHMDRDRYAGPVGWMDADGDGEWGIALRCGRMAERDEYGIRLFAGCGIVAGSDPETELAEATAKLMPMRDSLSDR